MTGRSPRAGLGNPPNGNAPRPPGACRILMIGDIIGKPGRVVIEQVLSGIRDERGIDFVTANGENVAGGMGLTPSTAEALLAAGVDVITSGNHIWDKREIYPFLETSDRVLRPLNYGTHDVPGRGWVIHGALPGEAVDILHAPWVPEQILVGPDHKVARPVDRITNAKRFEQNPIRGNAQLDANTHKEKHP